MQGRSAGAASPGDAALRPEARTGSIALAGPML